MKISIITATYNSAETVGDTLASVAAQDYADIEHIVVDGLSTDTTLNIVNSYPHIAKVVSERDKGIYDAMNKGISLANGDIVGILNSDDFYIDTKVMSEVAAMFNRDPSIQCVYSDLVYVNPIHTDKVVRRWISGEYGDSSFVNGWMPPHPTFFVRKEVYNQYGVFNLSLKTAADYELMLRILHKHHCKCAYLPRTIIKMRTGGASNQSILSRIKGNTQDRKAWEINGLKPKFYTFYLKPLRKVLQYFF